MDAEALEREIQTDRAAGGCPAVVIGTIGSTSIGAMDDLRAIGEVARRHGLYFHVDAAWAGSALICEEHRHLIDGIEMADSFVFNPHKWLLTNFDCTAHFVRDPDALVQTLGIQPDYLKTQGEAGINYSEWSVPLGRRFRAPETLVRDPKLRRRAPAKNHPRPYSHGGNPRPRDRRPPRFRAHHQTFAFPLQLPLRANGR